MNADRKNVLDAELELALANFKLDVLHEIIRLLPDLSEPERTLSFIMDRVFSLVEMEGASILLLDESGGNLEFYIVRGEKEPELKGVKMDAGKGIAGRVLATAKPVLIENAEDAEIYRKIDETVGYKTRSLIAVPIKLGGRSIGVLEGVNIDAEEVKTPAQLSELFESLASIISVTIEHMRLVDRLQHELQTIRTLLDVSRTVNSSLDLRDVLETVMSSAEKLLGVEAASLLLLDKKRKNLEFHVAHGEKKNALTVLKSIPVEKGIAGYVARTGVPVICNDTSKDKRFDNFIDTITGYKTRTALSAPIGSSGETIGVLEVINKKNGAPFEEEDLKLLQTIANESAVAVKNSLLLEEKNELFEGGIEALAKTLDARDEYNFGHAARVAFFAERIARTCRPDDYMLHESVRIAGLIHDIGKVGIPDSVLLKPGPLDAKEIAIARAHVGASIDITSSMRMSGDTLLAVRYHHERHDGAGYPEGMKGGEIPLSARILSVADAFDAMTSGRSYHEKKSLEEAAAEIKSLAGAQFDPDVVEIFLLALEHGLLDENNGETK
jgi:HD-GYP domain-containing protein (c-di-GMP phosphodiesterase class II)